MSIFNSLSNSCRNSLGGSRLLDGCAALFVCLFTVTCRYRASDGDVELDKNKKTVTPCGALLIKIQSTCSVI